MRRSLFTLLGSALLLLTACAPTPQATPLVVTQLVEQAPTQLVVVTPTPLPSATVPPTPTQRPKQPSLFGYISLKWTQEYLPFPFGPHILYVDYEQIRADLGFSSPGEPILAEQAPALFAALSTSIQGFELFPDSKPISRSAKDQIGWDFTDIQQILVVPHVPMTIMQGVFDRVAIARALESSGYQRTTVGRLAVFSPPQFASTYYLINPDVIVLTNSAENRDVLAPLFQGSPPLEGTADSHPTVQRTLNDPEGLWGTVLSPSSDMLTASLITLENTAGNPEVLKILEERAGGSLITNSPNWDFMAISFKGVTDGYRIRFLYHYKTADQAATEQELARSAITDGPSYWSRGLTWADMVSLESIEVQGEHLLVTGTTQMPNLIGRAVGNGDLGFLPIPPID